MVTVTGKVREFLKEHKTATLREIRTVLQLETGETNSALMHLKRRGEIKYENKLYQFVSDGVYKTRSDKGIPRVRPSVRGQCRAFLVERGFATISEIIAGVGQPYSPVYAALYALAQRGEVLRGSDGKWMLIPQQAEPAPAPAPVSWEEHYRESMHRGVEAARQADALREAARLMPNNSDLAEMVREAEERAEWAVRPRAFTRIRVEEYAGIPAFTLWLQEGCDIDWSGVQFTYRVEDVPSGFRDADWWRGFDGLRVYASVRANPFTKEPRWEWEIFFPGIGAADRDFTAHIYRAALKQYKLPNYHTIVGPHGQSIREAAQV